MILKKSFIAVIFCIAWTDGIFAISYSNVYVNSGSNGPHQYVGYGAPAVGYSAPIARLAAAPIGSVVPYAQSTNFLAPCVSPCAPQQPVAAVANAGLVAYTPPRAPVVVARDVPSNYEYSYIVYDDGTGDQKSARELSEGGVVQGQYSFLQPDGYVREVQYTADDVSGFNAVVNYTPGGGGKTVEVKEAKPCPEVKPEAIKQAEESKASSEHKTSGESSAELSSGSKEETSDSKKGNNKENKAEGSEEEIKKENSKEEGSKQDSKEIGSKEGSKEEGNKEGNSKEGSKEETSKEEVKSGENETAKSSEGEITAEVVEEKSHSKETPDEHAKHAVIESVVAPPSGPIVTYSLPPGYVSYEQLLKCIQKMQDADSRVNSPLTYILLPSNAKPC